MKTWPGPLRHAGVSLFLVNSTVVAAVAVLLALLLLLGLLILWWRARNALRARYAGRDQRRWVDAAPPPLEGRAAELDAEWRRLGYQPAGWLSRGSDVPVEAVYVHPSLPIFAVLEAGGPDPVTCLLSYFTDGSQITTTSSGRLDDRIVPPVAGSAHLVQLRIGGTPTALDGQHVGTVQAWLQGRRQPQPASPEKLIDYRAADEERVGEALERVGWLPFGTFIQDLIGRSPGVLKF